MASQASYREGVTVGTAERIKVAVIAAADVGKAAALHQRLGQAVAGLCARCGS